MPKSYRRQEILLEGSDGEKYYDKGKIHALN